MKKNAKTVQIDPQKEGNLYTVSYEGRGQTLLLFLHGLGDSHLNYLNFAENSALQHYDILIPDLFGYGRSTATQENFSFLNQVNLLITQIKKYAGNYKNIILIPHSMAGIHAVMLATSVLSPKIKGIYAIETSITQYGSFLADKINECENEGKDTHAFLKQWIQNIQEPIYAESLKLANRQCMIDNCLEMHALAHALPNEKFTHKTGRAFVSLDIPKVYCMAAHGKQRQSIPFLEEHNIQIDMLDSDSHFCAQECEAQFLENLLGWLRAVI